MEKDYYYRFVKERLGLFQEALRRDTLKDGLMWRIEPGRVRFHLGESIVELRVPYLLGGDDEMAIERAIRDLALLIKARIEGDSTHGWKIVPGMKENPSHTEDLLSSSYKGLPERSYRIDLFLPDSIERIIAMDILSCVPLIDSWILKGWLEPEGSGRAFISKIGGILDKSIKEELHLERKEMTSYLTLLALIGSIRVKKGVLKGIKIRGLSYERLEQMVGLTLFFTIRDVIKDRIGGLAKGGVFYYGLLEEIGLSLNSGLTPKGLLSITEGLLRADVNPYRIPQEVIPPLTPLYDEAVEEARREGRVDNITHIISSIEEKVRGKPGLVKQLTNIHRANSFRGLIIGYLLQYDTPGMGIHPLLIEVYQDNRTLQALFSDTRMRDRIRKGLEDIKRRSGKDTNRMEGVDAILDFLSTIKRSNLLERFRGKREEGTFNDIIEGFLAYRFDEGVERSVAVMREVLTDKRHELTGEMLIQEYERGRVYRFSSDERPILMPLKSLSEGHLFVDMKDFTRKTLKLKGIAMAEFMRINFYKPILEAASKYGAHLAVSGKGIRLDNLLGDALVFSGDVANLVSLTQDILLIMKRYKDNLEKMVAHISADRQLSGIHEEYKVAMLEIGKEKEGVERALQKGKEGARAKMMELKEKERRLEEAYREELEGVIGKGMEAGLFISYGAKAETISVRDDFWGEVRVSIGEKINEAARGTSRNPTVRAKVEMKLEKEKLNRGKPYLQYPFEVYIDKTYGLLMTPEMDFHMDRLITHRDISSAKELTRLVTVECLRDLERIVSNESLTTLRLLTTTGDIYNKGQAISEEALRAYMEEARGDIFFFKINVRVSDLHPDIQDRFFFPEDPVEIWFDVRKVEGVEMVAALCRIGMVTFKGFESCSPTVVYEIINRDSEFFKLLLKHHFPHWLEEARKSVVS